MLVFVHKFQFMEDANNVQIRTIYMKNVNNVQKDVEHVILHLTALHVKMVIIVI